MKEIRTIKFVEQTEVKFVADDGREFIGENAERDCRDYERTQDRKKVEQAFGAPVIERHTVSKNELIITGGSFPLDEDKSYDSGQVKVALGERQARIKEIEDAAKAKSKPAAKKPSASDFGF